jgi:hypothetical protein
MTKEQIERYLIENCNVNAPDGAVAGTGIKEIWSKIYNNGKTSNIHKNDVALALAEWYADEQNIIGIWNGCDFGLFREAGLNDTEKEFISVYVQYNGSEFLPTTRAIAEKHGIEIKNTGKNRWSGYMERDFWDGRPGYSYAHLRFLHLIKQEFPDTKAVYLFPGGKGIPPFVLSVLKEIIPPMTFEYPEFIPAKTDTLICREKRVADIAAVVRFAGSEQLKVKSGTFDITKAKLAKMAESIGFKEVCDDNGKFSTPREVKRINDLRVALPLFLLAANSGLVEVQHDLSVKPSVNSVAFLSRPMHEVARELFKDYLNSECIYETHYITYIAIYDGEYSIPWSTVRLPIMKLLQTCPVGQFIDYRDFEKYALIFCGDFFRDNTQSTVFVRGFSSSYYGSYTPDWSECEAQIVRLLLSFCGALGMLDIAYTEHVRGFKFERDDYRVGISGFRITPLGAWILGMTEKYDAPETVLQSAEGELIVQPDHTVMISGLKERVEHETYLSKFLTKVSVDDNVAVYKIDFAGIVKAFDQKIIPTQIKDYLKSASGKPLPVNVIRSLDDWQAKVGRIKIRSVTILETDDDLLLQELIHIKGMDRYTADILKHAVVIEDEAKRKIKTFAEKNGWVVDLRAPNP